MLNVLLTGKLAKDPKTGNSRNGHPWTAATIRVPLQPNQEGEADSLFVSTIAFGSEAEKLGRLTAGDAVSVTGTAKLSTWTGTDGISKPQMDIQAVEVLTAYALRKKRGEQPSQPSRNQGCGRGQHGHGNGFDYDDRPGF
jgi:single-stranded DNA-binding protein